MYCSVCKKQQISKVSQDDFIGLCKMLEARGILGLKKAKETRLMKVSTFNFSASLVH
jgi:cell division control protein 6